MGLRARNRGTPSSGDGSGEVSAGGSAPRAHAGALSVFYLDALLGKASALLTIASLTPLS